MAVKRWYEQNSYVEIYPVMASRKSPADTGDQKNLGQNWWEGTTCWTSNKSFLRVRAPGVLYVGCRHTTWSWFSVHVKSCLFPILTLKRRQLWVQPQMGDRGPHSGCVLDSSFCPPSSARLGKTCLLAQLNWSMPGGGKSSIKMTGLLLRFYRFSENLAY